MKILFSSSESKTNQNNSNKINEKSFSLKALYQNRIFVLKKYNDFIKNLSFEKLKQFLECKTENEIKYFSKNIFEKKTIKAIKRYNGVAYKALDYDNLTILEQNFIDNNLIIFSNLFGPINANDLIPDYKFKQNKKIGSFCVEKYFAECSSNILDRYLLDEDILDLRAYFYKKFYTPKKQYTTIKFLKNKKAVSHYAKFFRGIIVKEIAKNNITDTSKISSHNFEGLKLLDILVNKNETELVFNVTN